MCGQCQWRLWSNLHRQMYSGVQVCAKGGRWAFLPSKTSILEQREAPQPLLDKPPPGSKSDQACGSSHRQAEQEELWGVASSVRSVSGHHRREKSSSIVYTWTNVVCAYQKGCGNSDRMPMKACRSPGLRLRGVSDRAWCCSQREVERTTMWGAIRSTIYLT